MSYSSNPRGPIALFRGGMVCLVRRGGNRIDQRSILANDRARRQPRLIEMRFSQDMEDTCTFSEEIVGDDPSMAAPPDRFSAHDGAPALGSKISQPGEPLGERIGQGVVRIVPKTPHLPKPIHRGILGMLFSSKAAEFGEMLIPDLPRRESLGEGLFVELRIGAGPRHGSHVHDSIDRRFPEEIDELRKRPGSVSYGEEGIRHRRRFSARWCSPRREFPRLMAAPPVETPIGTFGYCFT